MSQISKAGLSAAVTLMLTLFGTSAHGAPIEKASADAGVINEQQILYWLVKRGELAADATEQQQRAAIEAFTQHARVTKGSRLEAETEKKRLAAIEATQADKLVGQRSTSPSDAAINKTVKILAVLVDFPDLPYDDNGLTAADTDMYYDSYPADHYRDLLFSSSGFAGPQGQTLQSGYQYYQDVSGETLFFTGDVKGWYRAENNAAYYGANDTDNNDSDIRADELVKEAVTAAVADMTTAELASYDVEDPYDLDEDGQLAESDGIIDHIMLFHSSVGEEVGGGDLGSDAIWSHRFFVDTSTSGYTIPGTSLKAYGYTVQPIDAAVGVCVHEFGHDLGLPDEYDLTYEGDGSPVGFWSLMSSGSWVGDIAGSQPSGFSPYARSYLQEKYKGNWINELDVSLSAIENSTTDVVLNSAADHQAGSVNQLSVALPQETITFKQPFEGQYQYYSNQGNLLNNAMYFTINLPDSDSLSLSMMAHWQIEQDYDYMQVKVDGVAIPGNYTKATNSMNSQAHIITGNSSDNSAAIGTDSWVELEYDLSAYKDRSVDISINYTTDESVSEEGIAIDELKVTQDTNVLKDDGAETANSLSLSGFVRITDERPGAERRYIVQLRNYQGVDSALSGKKYEPGVLLWLENFSIADNNVSEHPGKSLIGVIDADQSLIGSSGTEIQIRDAAFSMYDQSAYSNDTQLTAIPLFDDSLDYSSPSKPQAGMQLPELGLTMEVIEQELDSSSATVRFSLSGDVDLPLIASFTPSMDELVGQFSSDVSGGVPSYSYLWDFGDNNMSTAASPSHTYEKVGTYLVTLKVTDSESSMYEVTQSVSASSALAASFSYQTTDLLTEFTSTTTVGSAVITSYLWDFGDGQQSTSSSPSHTYSAAGTYTVTLTAADSAGASSQTTQAITVAAAATTTSTSSSSSGGGSLGCIAIVVLALFGMRRKYYG